MKTQVCVASGAASLAGHPAFHGFAFMPDMSNLVWRAEGQIGGWWASRSTPMMPKLRCVVMLSHVCVLIFDQFSISPILWPQNSLCFQLKPRGLLMASMEFSSSYLIFSLLPVGLPTLQDTVNFCIWWWPCSAAAFNDDVRPTWVQERQTKAEASWVLSGISTHYIENCSSQ